MKSFALCLIAALAWLTGCKKDVSGSYLAADESAVCWLHLVRTPDDHLTGQMVSSVLKPDGEIDEEPVSLTGAVNAENITLTGGGFLGMGTMTLTGTFNGNTLALTVRSMPLTLKRSTLADYQAKLGEQTTRSKAIISELATAAERQRTFEAQNRLLEAQNRVLEFQNRFANDVDSMIGRMQQFEAEADVHLGEFPNVEKGYEVITAKVNLYVTQERQLVGDPSRAFDRSQLDQAATQASLNTDQMHSQGQDLQSSLQTNITPLVNDATALEPGCRQTWFMGGSLPPVRERIASGRMQSSPECSSGVPSEVC